MKYNHGLYIISLLIVSFSVTVYAAPSDSQTKPENQAANVQPPEDMFIRTVASSYQIYPGETLQIQYHVYINARRGQVFYDVTEPDFNHWFNYEGKKPNDSFEFINNIKYTKEPFAAYYISTYQTGQITLPQIRLQVPFLKEKPWIFSDPVTIQVVPLPEPSPDHFYPGNVGHFTIESQISRKTVHVGEILPINIQISSNAPVANIHLAPYLSPDNIFISDPIPEEKPQITENEINRHYHSSAVFHKYIRLTKEGQWTLPAIKMVTFDPDAHQYQTVHSEPMEITVLPSDNLKDSAIHTNNDSDKNSGYSLVVLFISIAIIFIIIGILTYLFIRHLSHKNKRKNALKSQINSLKDAKTIEQQYDAMRSILSLYFNISESLSGKERINEIKKHCPADQSEPIISVYLKAESEYYSTHQPISQSDINLFTDILLSQPNQTNKI